MNKRTIVLSLALTSFFAIANTKAQEKKVKPEDTEVWLPEPMIVTPGHTNNDAPSDAIVLFNGHDINEWKGENGGDVKWKVEKEAITVANESGGIVTKKVFGDCQLHIEWRAPEIVKGSGQGRGNSGIFLMSRYELQVLDSYNNKTYVNGQAGSIYKQLIPLVNANRKPGDWQTYDVIFTAPRFNQDGSVKAKARITVIQNGILVQNNATIMGSTEYTGIPTYKKHNDKEPLLLQNHGDSVSYRNIWIREL